MDAPAVGRFSFLPMPFDLDCRACPRLATFLDEVRVRHPDYHARPVPGARLRRPRARSADRRPRSRHARRQRSGRPFTGDYAGVLLYETLHRFG